MNNDVHIRGLTVSLDRDELDGGWVAEVTELPGCVSEGESVGEALRNVADAYEAVMEVRSERMERHAIENALYALNPNQGEKIDATAAAMWLRTTLPEDHPSYLTWEYVKNTLGWSYA